MKRKHNEVRDDILEVLSDNKEHAYGDLERKANTNWQTIRDHCKDLELFGAVVIDENNKVKITKQGLVLLKKIKEQN
ncbi:MAG: winged helix-turn-helix domain-containing protein [Nanoarchaeota archaeon]|nr:winged helix-turn-helix domain-containing protein [Nanoarchaeota archaeon]